MLHPRNYVLAHRPINGNASLLANAYSIKWGLRLGKPGFIEVVLPELGCQVNPLAKDSYTINDFDQNDWLEFTRSYGATGVRNRVGPAPFLINRIRLAKLADGRKVINLRAETPLSVLERRINPYDGDDARSDFPPLTADDFCQAVGYQ